MEVHYLPGCCFCLFRPRARWENIFTLPKVEKEINKFLAAVRREKKNKPKNATNKPAKQKPTKVTNSSENKQTNTSRHNKTHKYSEGLKVKYFAFERADLDLGHWVCLARVHFWFQVLERRAMRMDFQIPEESDN